MNDEYVFVPDQTYEANPKSNTESSAPSKESTMTRSIIGGAIEGTVGSGKRAMEKKVSVYRHKEPDPDNANRSIRQFRTSTTKPLMKYAKPVGIAGSAVTIATEFVNPNYYEGLIGWQTVGKIAISGIAIGASAAIPSVAVATLPP
ncbi:hypothetical protein LCL89_03825 [Halobacillus yeomjeoni]|uniref:hypothetical protein n=1 Tax=Halobacillus yeomjeoni TaxID=311194 RepID=UPI001CD51846|nr:hypothetical protein [Halobacillus yeomjeoni]MCA0983175.1 hypothetical protein [Halobacillus yeomjeoni]